MKKGLLLLSVLTILVSTQIFAQCNPTPFPGPELTYPDTNMGIAPAAETQYYEQTIIMRIPEDTIYGGMVIQIDSAGINSITGLPASMSWDTDRDNNYWSGNSYGCIIFRGTPAVGDAGIYNITLDVSIKAFGTSTPYLVDYKLEILDASHVSIKQIQEESFKVLQNQPNPFANYTQINYVMPNANDINFSVYDILGNRVANRKYSSTKGENSIKFYKDNLANGIYIYELNYNDKIIRKRMVIK